MNKNILALVFLMAATLLPVAAFAGPGGCPKCEAEDDSILQVDDCDHNELDENADLFCQSTIVIEEP